jgi:hypothetical protein
MMVDANSKGQRPLPAAVNGKNEQRRQEEAVALQAAAYMNARNARAMWQQLHDARTGGAREWCGAPETQTYLQDHHHRRPLVTATYAKTTTTTGSCNLVYFDEESSSSSGTEPNTTISTPDDATSSDPALACHRSMTEFDRRLARAMDDVLAPADSNALRTFAEHRLQALANNFPTGTLAVPADHHRADTPNLDHHCRKTWP